MTSRRLPPRKLGRNTGFRIIDLLGADPEQVVRNWKDYPAIRKIIRSKIEAV